MAFVLEKDERNKDERTGSSSTTLPTTGGGTSAGNVTPPSAAPQRFAGLTDYLAANQGQAGQVAGNIASNLGTQFQGLQGDITKAGQQAQEAITAGTTPYNEQLVKQATENPAQFVANPQNVTDWQKLYGAQYTGPQSFETTPSYAQAQSAANKAAQTAQLGKTTGGYSQLLNQLETNPTQGKKALDIGLLRADPNAQQTIQTALNPFKGLQDYMASKSAEIGKQASEAAKTTGETAAKTKSALAESQKGFESGLQTNLSKAQQEAAQKNEDINNAIKNLYSPERTSSDPVPSLVKLGLTPEQAVAFANSLRENQTPFGIQAKPIDLASYATLPNPEVDINAYNTATAADYARAKALSQLSGNQNMLLPEEYATQAGTAPRSDINLRGTAQDLLPFLQQQKNYYTSNPALSDLATQDQRYMDILRQYLDPNYQPTVQPIKQVTSSIPQEPESPSPVWTPEVLNQLQQEGLPGWAIGQLQENNQKAATNVLPATTPAVNTPVIPEQPQPVPAVNTPAPTPFSKIKKTIGFKPRLNPTTGNLIV